MKKLPKLTWLLAAVTLFLAGNLIFTACTKDEESVSPSNLQTTQILVDETILVEKDHLVFKDEEHFQKTVLKTRNLSDDALLDWTTRYEQKGFTPFGAHLARAKKEYYQVMENGNEEQLDAFWKKWNGKVLVDEELILKPVLDLFYIRALVNERGIVKIGNNLVKYLNDRKIYISNGTEDKIAEAISLPLRHRSAEVFVMPIFRWKSSDSDKTSTQGAQDRCANTTNGTAKGSRRVAGGGAFAFGETEERTLADGRLEYLTYMQIGASVESYIRERSFGIFGLMWKSHDTNCTASGSVQFEVTYAGTYGGSFSNSCSDCAGGWFTENLPTVVSIVAAGSPPPDIREISGGGTFCAGGLCCSN